MRQLFAPAIRVMNRLRYPQKFLLIGFLLLIPTILLLIQYLNSINYDIGFAEAEQFGLEYNAPLLEILQGVQAHAVYSQLRLLDRGDDYADSVARAREQIAAAFTTAQATHDRLAMELRLSDEVTQLARAWQELLAQMDTELSTAELISAHLAFQEQVLHLITVVGNNSNLILDPDIDTYYLMDTVITKLPRRTVYLWQIQVTGIEAIASELQDRRLRLSLIAETAMSNLDANANGFQFAYDYNPIVETRLRSLVDSTFASTRSLLQTAAEFDQRSGSLLDFHTSMSTGLATEFSLYTTTARELNDLLLLRISRFEAGRNIVLAVTLVAVLASVYFFVGFYLAVRQTIDDLRLTSENMISGQIQTAMTLKNHDEFEEIVTAFNNIANEMVSARDRAVQASRLKDEFLATMSHELRTPLNSIIGYTGILMSGMRGQVDDVAKTMLGRVRESSQNLLNLINDILDIAKIEAGRMEITETPYNLRDLVASVQSQTEVLARQKELNFEVVIDPTLPEQVLGDADKIGQVLRNLLSNAVKFTEEGVVRLKVFSSGGALHFEVSDTGIGIPPQALNYIFDEFRQVDGSTRRKYGGTGLGLSIVRRFCLAMGGRIHVQSKLGAGSTFTAVLPLRAVTETKTIAEGRN